MTRPDGTVVSDEWVMIGTSEPQNFYVGRVVLPHPEFDSEKKQREFVLQASQAGYLLHLADARMLLTLLQMQPSPQPNLPPQMGMLTQLVPISASGGPVDLHLAAKVVLFPADVPGFAEKVSEMVAAVSDREMRARAAAAGLSLDTTMPHGRRS
jgi:hypothetical protein